MHKKNNSQKNTSRGKKTPSRSFDARKPKPSSRSKPITRAGTKTAPKVFTVFKKAIHKAPNETPEFPMRLNRYLSWKGIETRRGADELIERGKVTVNGIVANVGMKVNETDIIDVRGTKKSSDYVYLAYNKPSGVVTHSAQQGELDILRSIKSSTLPKNVFPLGRLDKQSRGLIILTNDGRITDKLLNPIFIHEKEYVVETGKDLRNNFKEKMEGGVTLEDGYITKPCRVTILDTRKFSVVLSEGKKHQIRRMCVALFNEVKDLQRVRIMNIALGKLASNNYRKIDGAELIEFKKELGF